MARPQTEIRGAILERVAGGRPSGKVWTWSDFADLGSHENVERVLQRMAASHEAIYESCRSTGDWAPFFVEARVIRVARGLYFGPDRNRMTRRPTVPSTDAVIAAVVGRSGGRWLQPPEAAAHALGITNLVPARLVVETDARIQPVRFGNRTIEFQTRSAKRLHWAGRPGSLLLQGLSWSRDLLHGAGDEAERIRIRRCVSRYLAGENGPAAVQELRSAIELVDDWMRDEIDLAMEEAGLDPIFAPSWQSDAAGDGDRPDPDDVPSGPRP
ncbi:DUF6088 family protein [Methylobacterium sp. 092160098-2]|uniref:DUF6088 family protein n=1 Tax=Methylobacterium sp. 092160098-2 TaxID=3025129 RepID=UPI002381AECB|nr:DUF6088 family protein [Methylobacterium sp. 092160098-2]MDE4913976.1 DUF6088 family protein [Methylobacterium sp. 092160098-2]